MASKFQVDEWAVLKTTIGGRMYQIHAIDGDNVYERDEREDQQKYVQPIWADSLVKVASKVQGEKLVAVLTWIYKQHQKEMSKQLKVLANSWKEAVLEYEVWENNDGE